MTNEMKKQYNEYMTAHVAGVKKAFEWLNTYLPEVIPDSLYDIIEENIETHDISKYSDEEFIPYTNYFYGKKTSEVEAKFNYAWLHHIHQNPHHWQYWMLQHDKSGLELLEMPLEYIIEMICDWWSFSFKSNNLSEIFSWYEEHKKDIKLNDKSRQILEDILAKIKIKL